MKLTLSVRSFHVPATPRTCAWPPSFPSVPTSRATRVTSAANGDGDLLRQIAVRDRRRHLRDVANLIGEVRRHRVDGVGQVFPRARNAADVRLTAELPFRSDLARDARDLGRERAKLIDHR